jgi:hypothetical protein
VVENFPAFIEIGGSLKYVKTGALDHILDKLHPFYTLTPYFCNIINICPINLSGLFS